jgi:hypothetical protein
MMNEITRHRFRFRIPSMKMKWVGQLSANESHTELEDRRAPGRKALNRKDRKELPPGTQRKNSLNAKS